MQLDRAGGATRDRTGRDGDTHSRRVVGQGLPVPHRRTSEAEQIQRTDLRNDALLHQERPVDLDLEYEVAGAIGLFIELEALLDASGMDLEALTNSTPLELDPVADRSRAHGLGPARGHIPSADALQANRHLGSHRGRAVQLHEQARVGSPGAKP